MMRNQGVDALLIYSSTAGIGTVNYLSNYISWMPTYLIFPLEGEPTLILHFYNHIPCTREMAVVEDIQWHFNNPVKSVVENLTKKKLNRSTIGVVGLNSIPYYQFNGIREKMPEANFVDVSSEYNMIRWVRSEEEIEWFRKSAHLTDLTVEALEKRIKPGLTEHDLTAIVYDSFLRHGGQLWIAFISTTSMDEPTIYVPWQFPTSRVVKPGHVVITEITVGYYGYNAQIHRPFAVGREPTPLYRRLYETALECFERVSDALRDGATTGDILKAASVIEEHGFTVYDSLLHGEGAKNPELGSESSIHPKEHFTFRKNMVMVIQPQPVTPDLRAGIQLGAAVVVGEDRARSLHNYPLKFPICGI